jgi:hypothetical protein
MSRLGFARDISGLRGMPGGGCSAFRYKELDSKRAGCVWCDHGLWVMYVASTRLSKIRDTSLRAAITGNRASQWRYGGLLASEEGGGWK